MRFSLAAARKYALINGIYYVHMLFIDSTASTASLSDEDAVYLIDVVGGLHICKTVRSPTVCEGLQLTCEDRNNDRFAACLQVQVFLVRLSGGWPSRVVWKAVLLLVPSS